MANASQRETKRVRVSGKVQGVWFRAWTEETATGLGLDGWVRNLPDGGVEALISGPPDRVAEMLTRMAGGPPLARVDRVETEAAEPPREAGFSVRR